VIQNDYNAPIAQVLVKCAFDFLIQLVLGLKFADTCARSNLSNIREHFY